MNDRDIAAIGQLSPAAQARLWDIISYPGAALAFATLTYFRDHPEWVGPRERALLVAAEEHIAEARQAVGIAKSQLALFRDEVREPGKFGGRWYRTEKSGKIRYGRPPEHQATPPPGPRPLHDSPFVVSYGGGVDSTAMLVEFFNRGIRPDMILFADVGAEKPETYAYLATMQRWLESVGFPPITVVRYVPPRAPYADLEGNCLANETLPSLAFGMHSCSLKWKVAPQERAMKAWGPALDAWGAGKRVLRAIGYDNSPADRRRSGRVYESDQTDERYAFWYPLQEWGIDRARCQEIIRAAGLPVPVKSACFFCPGAKQPEILELAEQHPSLAARAIEMEDRARTGKHQLRSTAGLGRRFSWADVLGDRAQQLREWAAQRRAEMTAAGVPAHVGLRGEMTTKARYVLLHKAEGDISRNPQNRLGTDRRGKLHWVSNQLDLFGAKPKPPTPPPPPPPPVPVADLMEDTPPGGWWEFDKVTPDPARVAAEQAAFSIGFAFLPFERRQEIVPQFGMDQAEFGHLSRSERGDLLREWARAQIRAGEHPTDLLDLARRVLTEGATGVPPVGATPPRPKLVLTPPPVPTVAPPPDPEPAEERPRAAKRYSDGRVEDWEVLEADYVTRRIEQREMQLRRNVQSWTERAETLRREQPKAKGQIKEADYQANLWARMAADWEQNAGPNQRQRDAWRADYLKTVKAAISKGKPVPLEVIRQRPEFQKALTARQRYQKGWHTSFANESVAVTRVTQGKRGFKVKRQDGKDITAAQIREIEQGMDELESVFGPLGDICRFADLTIAHTNGKMPFLKTAGGVFHPDEDTISIGVKDVKALAHEFAHFLDFRAGHLQGRQTKHYSQSNRYAPPTISTSLADADAYDRAYGRPSPAAELLREATQNISNTQVVMRQMKVKLDDVGTEEGKREIRRARVSLGSYWRRPHEVFARLVEQYLTHELTARGTPPAASADVDYDHRAGWWRDAQFERWKPAIKAEVARRLEIIRDGILAQGPPQPMAKGRVGVIPRLVLMLKAQVARPGSRGGTGYYNDRGKWQYGKRPNGVNSVPPNAAGPSVYRGVSQADGMIEKFVEGKDYHFVCLKTGGFTVMSPDLSKTLTVGADGVINADFTPTKLRQIVEQIVPNVRAFRESGADPSDMKFLRYVRRGGTPLPPNGRSRNAASGKLEPGVSVYLAQWNPTSGELLPHDFQGRSTGRAAERSGLDVYLVQGKMVGRGSDGEPLLGEVRVAVKLTSSYPHRLTGGVA